MERGFQAMLMDDDDSDAFSPGAFIGQATDDACSNALYSAMNSQSFLSVTDKSYLLQSVDYGYGTLPATPSTVDPVSFGFLGQDLVTSQSKEVNEWSVSGDRKLKSVDFGLEKLKMPKYEPLSNNEVNDVSTEPFNFLSSGSVSTVCDLRFGQLPYSRSIEPFDFFSSGSVSTVCDLRFGQLPYLRSPEQDQDGFAFGESSRKRVKSLSPTSTDTETLDSLVRNFQFPNYFTGLKPLELQAPAVAPQSALARQRRQKISDKTRCLQKLLPWDKKMDTTTMLEEAYKYIKFLQAQISVLQSMPCDSSSFATQTPGNINVFGGLGRLNRQQLLQVWLTLSGTNDTLLARLLRVLDRTIGSAEEDR